MISACRWSLAIALAACVAANAAPHRFRVFANPSIVVLAIVEDADGFLWLAAEDGAYRFDGFHFRKASAFPLPSAQYAGATRDGSIWLAGTDGLVRYRNGAFQVVQRDRINSFAITPDYVFVKNGTVYRRFNPDGSVDTLHRAAREQMTEDPSGRLWFSSTAQPRAELVDPAAPDAPIETVALPEPFEQVARDRAGRLWAAHDGAAVQIAGSGGGRTIERRQSRRTQRPYPLMAGRGGDLWFVGETIERLGAPENFAGGPSGPQNQPTCAYEDSRGRLWVAVLGIGLVEWMPDPGWQRWSSDEPVAQIVESPGGVMTAATRGNLYSLDAGSDAWVPQASARRDYAALAALPGVGWLVSIRRAGVLAIGRDGTAETVSNALPTPDQYRVVRRDAEGRLWVGNKAQLFRVDGSPGSFRLTPEDLPDVQPGQFAQSVDLDVDGSGRLWAGYGQGLAWRDAQGRWTRIVTDRPVRDIRSFALGPGGSVDDIWVAYRGSGRFSRLVRSGSVWHVSDFTPAAGYGPPDTHFIKRDSRGWIWRGAPDGVHLSDGVHVQPNQWIHISPSTGLSTESVSQYGFYERRDRSVWIAGEDGMTRLQPDVSWFLAAANARPPKVLAIDADGREQSGTTIPARARDVRIEFGSLDAPEFYDAPFRYRLRPLDGGWKTSATGVLQLRDLPRDAYTLEIGFAPEGGPPPVQFRFRVGPPPLNAMWFVVPPVAAGAGALALFGPWFWWSRTNRYRLSKSIFLLRRRFASRAVAVESATAHDYSGHTFLGRYELGRAVSQGGFSVVYEGRDLSRAGARIAVKTLCAPPGAEAWLGVRFAHEIAALRTVRHPSVVEILDSWIAPGGEPCVAMPFLEGPTLRHALRDGPLPPPVAAQLVVRLAGALGEMHVRGIVHRDLKPENVMFAGASPTEPVIIDFGAASLRTRADRTNTTTLMAGSVRYMAPERLAGRFSSATDVFGLGLIAIETLTGRTLADFNAAIGDPSFEAELRSALDSVAPPGQAARVANALAQACHPQPQLRPADIRAWARELAAALIRG